MLAPLGREPIEERRAAANALASLGAEATPPIAQKLAELRKGGDGGMNAAVRAARERTRQGGGLRPARGPRTAEARRPDDARADDDGAAPRARARGRRRRRHGSSSCSASDAGGRPSPGALAADEGDGGPRRRGAHRGEARPVARDAHVGVEPARDDGQAHARATRCRRRTTRRWPTCCTRTRTSRTSTRCRWCSRS